MTPGLHPGFQKCWNHLEQISNWTKYGNRISGLQNTPKFFKWPKWIICKIAKQIEWFEKLKNQAHLFNGLLELKKHWGMRVVSKHVNKVYLIARVKYNSYSTILWWISGPLRHYFAPLARHASREDAQPIFLSIKHTNIAKVFSHWLDLLSTSE